MTRPLIAILLAVVAQAVEVPAVVQSVHDGDTITVAAQADGHPQRVRLLWIDTPEVGDNRHGRAMPEGAQARDLVRGLLPKGQAVVLWGPGDELERDPFKRELAVVKVGDSTVQEAVIAGGWSPVWEKYGRPPEPYRSRWEAAERKAREAGAGAWGTARQYMIDKGNETASPSHRKAGP